MDRSTPGGRGPSPYPADRYGRSFADVYDQWYPADSTTAAAVDAISSFAGPDGTILELGVGTGRLALPLVDRGHQVIGMDASVEMLEVLDTKRRRCAAPERLLGVLGDVADADMWPPGPFDAVVAAFNLVGNLLDPREQEAVLRCAAKVLAPGGVLLVESNEPAPDYDGAARLDARAVTDDAVVLIATQTDPCSGVIVGQHIELRDGEPPRLRPWRVRLCTGAELDEWAAGAGLVLSERRAGWDGHGTSTLSVFRLA